jgi:hypothetical protein
MPFSASPIQHLVVPRAVEIAGIQQGDPGIKRRMDGGDAFLPFRRPYMPDMPMQPRPRAETEGPFFPAGQKNL